MTTPCLQRTTDLRLISYNSTARNAVELEGDFGRFGEGLGDSGEKLLRGFVVGISDAFGDYVWDLFRTCAASGLVSYIYRRP